MLQKSRRYYGALYHQSYTWKRTLLFFQLLKCQQCLHDFTIISYFDKIARCMTEIDLLFIIMHFSLLFLDLLILHERIHFSCCPSLLLVCTLFCVQGAFVVDVG